MANNIHISYDLIDPGQNYDQVIAAIKQLGGWAKIHYSYWYVDSPLSADDVLNILLRVTDSNDSVYVVDATNNQAAWSNIAANAGTYINQHWRAKAA